MPLYERSSIFHLTADCPSSLGYKLKQSIIYLRNVNLANTRAVLIWLWGKEQLRVRLENQLDLCGSKLNLPRFLCPFTLFSIKLIKYTSLVHHLYYRCNIKIASRVYSHITESNKIRLINELLIIFLADDHP
jgi:hypothetical protein